MPVQDTEDARKTSEPVADAEEELRKQQAAKQEHQQDETSVQKSGKLLPFLNAKAEHHQSRIDTLDSKIATQQDKIAKHQAAIDKLSEKADRLEDKNRMLEATLGNLPLVRKFIEANEKKIAEIRENKIPAREQKIKTCEGKIAQHTAKRERISHKLDRVVALNDAIKSFSIGFNKERREAFADALSRLNTATVDCLIDKKDALSSQRSELMQKFNSPETSSVDKLKLQDKINSFTQRIEELEGKIMKLSRPETHYAEQTNDELDASMKLTQDRLGEMVDNGTVTMPDMAEETLTAASKVETLDKSQVAALADQLGIEPLAGAEVQLEDDYNMIDGIINNGTKADLEQAKAELLIGIKSMEELADNPFVSAEMHDMAENNLSQMKEKLAAKALKAKTKEIVAKFYEEFLSGRVTKVEEKVEPSVAVLSATPNGTTDLEFGDFLLKWLESAKPSIAFNSYVGYKGVVTRIKAYFDEHYPHLLLRDLTALQLQEFYNEKFNSGMSGNTVKHYHANIHKALKYAVKMDLLNINVADKVDLPKIKKFEANFYTKEELDELFEVFKGDRIELVVHIAAYYGLRKSEIIGLKWDSIDFNAKTITVRRKVSSTYGTGTEVIRVDNELKTKASERTFPLIPHIENMLRERKILEEHYSKLLGKDFDREYDGFVCRDNFGKLITPNFVTDHFKRVISRNKLKKLRFHDLRHSCASLLLAKGASMKAIQDWLGHSTFNVTANFYSHLDPRSKEKSAAMIAEVFGGESTKDKQDKDNGDEKNRKPSN